MIGENTLAEGDARPTKVRIHTPPSMRGRASGSQHRFELLLDMSIGLGADGRAADILATGWLVGEKLGLFERRGDFRMVYGTTVQSASVTRSIPKLEQIRLSYLETREKKPITVALLIGRELSALSISDLRRLGRYLYKTDSVLPDEAEKFHSWLTMLGKKLEGLSDVK